MNAYRNTTLRRRIWTKSSSPSRPARTCNSSPRETELNLRSCSMFTVGLAQGLAPFSTAEGSGTRYGYEQPFSPLSAYPPIQDIHLVLRRHPNGDGYEFIWKIDQRWVKGNRNPNTVVYDNCLQIFAVKLMIPQFWRRWQRAFPAALQRWSTSAPNGLCRRCPLWLRYLG